MRVYNRSKYWTYPQFKPNGGAKLGKKLCQVDLDSSKEINGLQEVLSVEEEDEAVS